MLSEQELLFAKKYPFSNRAKKVITGSNLALDSISYSLKNRAQVRLKHAFERKPYTTKVFEHDEALLNEVLSFPLSKIIVSLMGEDQIELLASSTRSTTKKYLSGDSLKKGLEPLIDLSQDLGLNVSIESQNLISIPVIEYLSFVPQKKDLKLVNQSVENGKIFLSKNDFIDFLAEKSFFIVFDSLPVKTDDVPRDLRAFARQVKNRFYSGRAKKYFKPSGKVNPNYFPDCMKSIYSQLFAGKNVPHMARFSIATFLNQIGMPPDEIIKAFSKTPNFNERLTRYQVERISGKGGREYSAPACSKMRTGGLCTKETCNERHPVSFYLRQFKKGPKKEVTQNAK